MPKHPVLNARRRVCATCGGSRWWPSRAKAKLCQTCHPDPLLALEEQEAGRAPTPPPPDATLPAGTPRRLLTNDWLLQTFLAECPEWRAEVELFHDWEHPKSYPMGLLSARAVVALIEWERRKRYMTRARRPTS